MSAAKVPAVPPAHLVTEPHHLRRYSGALFRIFTTQGPHPTAWDELRHYGPVAGMRFDPHPGRAAHHPTIGVMYTATDPATAFGEVYQSSRVIARGGRGATLVAWVPTRELVLLDLTTNWPVLNGASASIMMGPKRNTQAWAREIDAQLGGTIDGLWSLSSITSMPIITLFNRASAVPSFPAYPRASWLLADPAADTMIADAVNVLGYDVGP